MVKEYGSPPALTRPHPVIRTDVLDEDGNLHGADIGITWAGNETFLHGVRVVGPGPPRPSGIGPAISTLYQPTRDHDMENTSTSAQPPTPSTPLTVPDAEIQLRHPPQEIRQGYRPVAPIQRFNNKSLNWPAWFRHFRAVDQRALQLVSYLDETAMNVAQELEDSDLYNYNVLVKLLSDRFDPASRVSVSRSRFHGRFRRHHEDADAFTDALAELAEAWANRRAVREAIWSGAQEVSLGGDPDSEGKETPDSYWSLYGLLQLDGVYTHSPCIWISEYTAVYLRLL